MTSILDICLQQQFDRPKSPREFLALQIARRLNDLHGVREYAVLLEHFPEEIIVNAFHRARAGESLTKDGFLAAFRNIVGQLREETANE
jgi:hypothetical protein